MLAARGQQLRDTRALISAITPLYDTAWLERQRLRRRKAERQASLAEEKAASEQRDKAMLAAYKGKTRELADEIKKKIRSQLHVLDVCPYCEGSLGTIPHADHIYPVSKGGLSSTENMVYICEECNLRKSDLTLNQFIMKFGLDRCRIETNLTHLRKAF